MYASHRYNRILYKAEMISPQGLHGANSNFKTTIILGYQEAQIQNENTKEHQKVDI